MCFRSSVENSTEVVLLIGMCFVQGSPSGVGIMASHTMQGQMTTIRLA